MIRKERNIERKRKEQKLRVLEIEKDRKRKEKDMRLVDREWKVSKD